MITVFLIQQAGDIIHRIAYIYNLKTLIFIAKKYNLNLFTN